MLLEVAQPGGRRRAGADAERPGTIRREAEPSRRLIQGTSFRAHSSSRARLSPKNFQRELRRIALAYAGAPVYLGSARLLPGSQLESHHRLDRRILDCLVSNELRQWP
jgi:hypothetical protein